MRLTSLSKIVAPPVLPPLPKVPPKGIKVALIECTLPICPQTFAPEVAAINKLGWKLKTISFNLTSGPAGLNVAFAQAIQSKPNYIEWNSAFPYPTEAKVVSEARAAHIGLIPVDGEMEPTLLNCLSCAAEFVGDGKTEMKIAQATVKNPNVGLIMEPDLTTNQQELQGEQEQAKAAGGTVSTIAVSTTNTQQQNNQAVVSYLQSHPQIQFIVTDVDIFGQGLPTALKQSGLAGKVKYIIGDLSTPGDTGLIESGVAYSGVEIELEMGGYRVLDSMIRDAEHQPIPKSLIDPVGWQQVVTKANAHLTQTTLQAPNYEQDFFKDWHVG